MYLSFCLSFVQPASIWFPFRFGNKTLYACYLLCVGDQPTICWADSLLSLYIPPAARFPVQTTNNQLVSNVEIIKNI